MKCTTFLIVGLYFLQLVMNEKHSSREEMAQQVKGFPSSKFDSAFVVYGTVCI